MSEPANELFDQFADKYGATVEDVIAASGETVTYFADIKASIVASILSNKPVRLLDFGCGTGLSTRSLNTHLSSKSTITGVDISEKSVERARSETDSQKEITYEKLEGTDIPFANEAFDVAFTACVFHHIPLEEQSHWMKELYRVLRPGGILFVFEHNPYNPLTRRAVRDCPFDEGVILLRPSYTEALGRSAGFTRAKRRFYFFFPRFLSILRPFEQMLGNVPLGAQYYVMFSK